ncbi:uncharacterized protein LOC141904445 [Tubulanus polymorphus]|uniref:uncharacterized protein LOC141904445 n=1 Tax=Tubulanus polymorphus TaxID=672921 RepID=UPI003DA3CD21
MSSRLIEAANKNDVDLLYMALRGELGPVTEEELDNALVRAAVNGNTKSVHVLLENGANPDAADCDGESPLMLATANSKVSVVRLLLHYGCNVNHRSDHSRNAMHLAAWTGNLYLVKLLLERGGLMNVREKYGDVPLMLATLAGYDEVVEFLIGKKCDVNVVNYDNDSPLHYAARKGHLKCAAALLDAGAKINAQNNWGYTPLMLAVCEAREKMTKYLLARPGVNVKKSCQGWRTALHYAVRSGLTEILDALIDSGAFIDVVDSTGNTPLIEAVYHDHLDAVKLLAKGSCNVNITGQSAIKGKWCKCTPLDIALDRGHYAVAKVLLLSGNMPKLHHPAVMHEIPDRLADRRELLDFFVDRFCSAKSLSEICRGAIRRSLGRRAQTKIDALPLPKRLLSYIKLDDIDDIKSDDGALVTSLLTERAPSQDDLDEALAASIKHSRSFTEQLLAAGARPNGLPVITAIRQNKPDVVQLLLKHGCKISENLFALQIAAHSGAFECVKILTKLGASLEPTLEHGLTPVMAAVKGGDFHEIVEYLIKKGCDVDVTNHSGENALHFAARHGHVNCVKVLLREHADLYATTNWGYTPLKIAVAQNQIDVIELIMSKNTFYKFRQDKSLLHCAARYSHLEAIDILMGNHAVSIEQKNASNQTPFLVAVYHSRKDSMLRLLRRGCKITTNAFPIHPRLQTVNSNSATVLDLALDLREFDSVRMILLASTFHASHLKHVNLVSDFGKILDDSQLRWFVERIHGTPRLAELCRMAIRRYMCRKLDRILLLPLPKALCGYLDFEDLESTVVKIAVAQNQIDVIELIMSKNTFYKFRQDKSLLHCAARYSHLEAIDILMGNHAVSIEQKNASNQTPFLVAVYHSRKDSMLRLLRRGCKITTNAFPIHPRLQTVNSNSATVLDLALDLREFDSVRMILLASTFHASHLKHVNLVSDFGKILDDSQLRWFVERIHGTPRLAELCRMAIRRYMCRKLDRILLLPLPKALCGYLDFEDLERLSK